MWFDEPSSGSINIKPVYNSHSRIDRKAFDRANDESLLSGLLTMSLPLLVAAKVSQRLIEEFSTFAATIAASPSALLRIKGVTRREVTTFKLFEATTILSLRRDLPNLYIVSGWQSLLDYLHASMAHRTTEEFRVIFMNGRKKIIRDEVLFNGTVNAAPVYPREVIKRALELAASSVILVHNHPSGDPSPSRDDIVMTKAIAEAGRHLGLTVHDHVIIGRTGHTSMRALGLI